MQFASPSGYAQLVRRTRAGLPGGVLWTSVIVFLLTLAIAKSTVTAHWVDGIEIVPMVALAGAIVLGLLALLPIPWAAGLGMGMIIGPFAAGYAAWPSVHALHPTEAFGLSLAHTWWGRILDGSAIQDNAFDLFLISWLMWVTGGWLSWCVLHWRKPLLGLVPGAAAFDRRPDSRPGVQRIQQLGAAAADAQPSRGAGIWCGRGRQHRLLDRCAAQLIPQAQSRCGVRVHEDRRLC